VDQNPVIVLGGRAVNTAMLPELREFPLSSGPLIIAVPGFHVSDVIENTL